MNSLTRSENGLPANGCRRSETDAKQMKNRYENKKAQDLDCLRRYPVDTRFHLTRKEGKGQEPDSRRRRLICLKGQEAYLITAGPGNRQQGPLSPRLVFSSRRAIQ